MPRKKTPSRSRRKPSPRRAPARRSRSWSRLVPGLIAAGIFLALALLLSRPAAPPTRPAEVRSEAEILADLSAAVERLLARQGLATDRVQRRPAEGMLDLEAAAAFPGEPQLAALREELPAIAPDLALEVHPPRGELRIFHGVALVVRLRYFTPEPPPASLPDKLPDRPPDGPRIAIIIDDLGRDLTTVRRLLALEAPLSLAFLPGTAHPGEGARLAHAAGREVLVHIPMEPQGFPAIQPGSDALLLGHSPAEIRARLEEHFARVPHAVGANNHMGSRFTEYRQGMLTVADYLRERGVYFIDSATSPDSLAEATARAAGVAAGRRDVFLDNVADVAKIRAQLRALAQVARERGEAVGIGHPHPETIEALRLELPELRRQGFRVVAASELTESN